MLYFDTVLSNEIILIFLHLLKSETKYTHFPCTVCVLVTHCGRQPGSESVYCCCIRSVHASEKEVGRVVVGGGSVRVAGQAVAEVGAGLELEVLVLES